MTTAREQAKEIAGLHYRGHSIADIEAAITAALEEKEQEIERLRLLAAKNNSEAQRYLNALTTECRSDVETRQQLAEAVKLLEGMLFHFGDTHRDEWLNKEAHELAKSAQDAARAFVAKHKGQP